MTILVRIKYNPKAPSQSDGGASERGKLGKICPNETWWTDDGTFVQWNSTQPALVWVSQKQSVGQASMQVVWQSEEVG